MEQRQPVLLIPLGLFKNLTTFRRRFLPEQVFYSAVVFLDLFVEVLQERRIADSQILFLTVELVIGDRLDMFRLLNGGVMLRDESSAQCRELAELEQGVKVDPCHHHNDEKGC